jgi:hypothetical protein
MLYDAGNQRQIFTTLIVTIPTQVPNKRKDGPRDDIRHDSGKLTSGVATPIIPMPKEFLKQI